MSGRRVGNKDDAFVHSMTRLNASASSFQLSTKLRGRSKNTSQVASNFRDDLDPERRPCTRTMTRARLEIVVGSRALHNMDAVH